MIRIQKIIIHDTKSQSTRHVIKCNSGILPHATIKDIRDRLESKFDNIMVLFKYITL